MSNPSTATLWYPPEVFTFSGDTQLKTWSLEDYVDEHGKSPYYRFLNHEPVLVLQRIRELLDAFLTYQRTAETGRPPTGEHTHLIAILVNQFTGSAYRELASRLNLP